MSQDSGTSVGFNNMAVSSMTSNGMTIKAFCGNQGIHSEIIMCDAPR